MQSNRLQSAIDTSLYGRDEGDIGPTLADRLAEGPLPLSLALRYAASVAAALRQLHHDGRPHGSVNAAAVAVTPSGVVLKGAGASRQATFRSDIAAFGELLFEMVNGRKPGPDLQLPLAPRSMPRAGEERLKMAANRLAARCLSDDSLVMRKVGTELRLLKVLVRQLPRQEPQPPLQLLMQPQALEPPPSQPVEDEGDPPAFDHPEQEAEQASAEPAADETTSPGSLCPRCGSAYVCISQPRGKAETFLHTIGSPVRRCHRCYHRYFVFCGMNFAKSHGGDRIRRGA